MGGLLLLGVFLGWLAVAIWLARRISRHIKIKPSLRPVALFVLSILILFMPVADELAARPFFEAMCRERAVVKPTAQNIRGRTVRITVDPLNAPVSHMPIPVLRSHFMYRDASTGELLLEYDTFQAEGGFLSRAIPVVRGEPLTGTNFCAPESEPPIAEQYGIFVLD